MATYTANTATALGCELHEIVLGLDRLTAASGATGPDGRVVRATRTLVACATELLQTVAAQDPPDVPEADGLLPDLDGATAAAPADPAGGPDTALCSAIEELEGALRRLRRVEPVCAGTPANGRTEEEPRM